VTAADSLRERIEGIVIGASAGGVEALSGLLPALTASLKASVFVVLHLPRERPSLLTEIFAGKCSLPVREATDKEPARPGTLYFAPPDYHLLIEAGPSLALSIDEPVHFSRPSIDVLFESAADVYGEHLMGIILTGANDDGAEGLEKIVSAGGITVVQEPATAYESRMIEAALSRCQPHFVLPLRELSSLLASLCA
jgi:two-component system chemotaxis response regulator CheB